jgi:eukaryotic-like serine/threonine-protein kinase
VSANAEDTTQDLAGSKLGDGYLLQALIGQGAMGAVYRALSAAGAEVAVKTLKPELMGDHSRRFLRESQLVRGLRHAHVVSTLDAGVDPRTGLMFLVMPLLKGRDLEHVLDELGALEPQTAVRVALQAARGLSAAHRIDIVHRDVKPGNLILDEEQGELIVRVCDFGIAKQLGGASSLTATGSQLGTPDYVSPEQLKSSKHVDARADVWSLGATLYEMLSGVAPYSHIDSVFDLIAAIVAEDVPHLQGRAPWIEPDLCLVVHRALQRDPARRFATMDAFAAALRPLAGGDERLEPSHLTALPAKTRLATARRVDLRIAPPAASPPPPTPTAQPKARTPDVDASVQANAPSPERRSAVAGPARAASPRTRSAPAAQASKSTLAVVALASAVVAGGGAYLFARAHAPLAASPAAQRLASPSAVPVAPETAAALPRVSATVRITPPEASVTTPSGPVQVVAGVATLTGRAGEILNVTVSHGGTTRAYAVSLGSDGVATPGQLPVGP